MVFGFRYCMTLLALSGTCTVSPIMLKTVQYEIHVHTIYISYKYRKGEKREKHNVLDSTMCKLVIVIVIFIGCGAVVVVIAYRQPLPVEAGTPQWCLHDAQPVAAAHIE